MNLEEYARSRAIAKFAVAKHLDYRTYIEIMAAVSTNTKWLSERQYNYLRLRALLGA